MPSRGLSFGGNGDILYQTQNGFRKLTEGIESEQNTILIRLGEMNGSSRRIPRPYACLGVL